MWNRWFGKKNPEVIIPETNNVAISGDAIVKLLDHMKKTSEKYRDKVDEWENMAIELESKMPVPHRQSVKKNKETTLQLVGDAFKDLGGFLLSLHRLFEPASIKFRHILVDAHKSLNGLRNKFEAACEKLEAERFSVSKVEQDLTKLHILRMGVAIWDELIKLEVNVSALIANSLKEQKLEENGVNLAANLLFALILASIGNLENLNKVDICWEDIYRNYLFNALDGGKKVNLMEINFEGLLAHGEFLVNQNTSQNKHRYFTPNINVRTVTDETPGLHRTVSMSNFS